VAEIDNYDYELPKDLIAQHPLACRTDARLLVADRATGTIAHTHVRELPLLLRPSDCLVLNDTRVVPARLVGFRSDTGGRWSGLFVAEDDRGLWHVMGKTRGKLGPGDSIILQDRASQPTAQLTLVSQLQDGSWVAKPRSHLDTLSLLDCVGRVPLPPYIRGGEMVDADIEAYQTVFANQPGAVAAPTAGLHFTQGLLEHLQNRGLEVCRLTLHVGPGTFRPVTVDKLADHPMHAEWCSLDESSVECIRRRRRAGGRTIAVGTTSMRVLETAAQSGELRAWKGHTDLFIRPPFAFHACDALLTNFHLPRSTLLVLVRTFGGDALIKRAYAEAIREEYRFYSYGDAMLIV
jgi:S-adenosylmethionine:tRNA ribosyltransferase-isomerase